MIESNATFGIQTDAFSKFEHVVVLIIENQSSNNLLGNLCTPSESVPSQQFAGLKFTIPSQNI